MSSESILVVEDEQSIADTLLYSFQKDGYQVRHVTDGSRAIDAVREAMPDLIVMDILMAEMDGTEALRELRKFTDVPVVFLTSKTEEMDRVVGLELGADDYVTKPFSPRELLARVRAVLRRTAQRGSPDSTPEAGLEHGFARVDEARHEATWRGQPLQLTHGQFVILAALVRNPGIVLSRDRLLTYLDKDDAFVTDRVIDTHVKHIRKEIRKADSDADPIETVFGVGYKFRELKKSER